MCVRSFLGAGSALLVSALLAAAASAGPYKVKDLQAISAGPSLFPAGCPGAFHDSEKPTGLETEPAITANPANPRNVVATWKQDVSPAFNARDDLVASSLDGGKTWQRTTIPGLTRCTGGTSDTASDPWVSAAGDGTVYFGGQSGLTSTDPLPLIAIVASHSGDGGRHWAAPTTVAPRLGGNETPAITGSPTLPGHAYMVWANFPPPQDFPPPWANTVSFSRTTDGGITWSPPVLVDQPGPFAIDQAPRIRVLPNGTLLAIFARADFATGLAELRVARSLDEGQTWQPALLVGSFPLPLEEVVDPETGEELPQPGFPSSVVAPDGTVYIAFEHSTAPDAGEIGLLSSRDGLTWSSSTLPGVSAFAWEPVIAVDQHGTVGVIWYDIRNDRPGDGMTSADVWFAHSHNRGSSWRQTHVAGPTDIRTGGTSAQNRFGEYQGLAGLRKGFAAAFGLAAPQAQDGRTDIFFARIGPGDGGDEDDEDDRGQ
jgi:hypothetical protein